MASRSQVEIPATATAGKMNGEKSEQNGGDLAVAKKMTPKRHRLPETRDGLVHRFSIGGTKGYIICGVYPDGSLGEVFIVIAKEGSTLSGVMDSFAVLLSIALQNGIPLEDLVRKFSHTRFEPGGFTGNKEIPVASSIVDYIFRWLELQFLSREKQAA